ncbi:C4-type zinc ribbon domain-containing protein [Microbacterium sp. H1-D42]|uniref:zinc ribbon domain-containing protein n=1 Tax=Microbacterium sp. H1-D42 TaxID=2925844 RepID=UPI001F52EA6E|nr:C4-type zinc ribbon domain-containing protein [Microbacterium sp. H1-D42]UNK72373.1 C4-type zinc ribbon domain-containing protein [Microbacterium sp. H1-D42]
MKATPENQRTLLDIADLDRRITQTERARTKPAQGARINELAALRQRQLGELTTLTGVLDDAKAELSRLESDVALAAQRRDKDAERLAVATDPKQAQALENEIESLGRRISMLEDSELDVMGGVEEAQTAVDAQQALIDQTQAEGAGLTAAAKADIAAATTEGEHLARDRAALAASVAADLLAEYERRASRGIGVGLLRRGICEGCQMVLAGTDMNDVRRAAPDDVLSCPECGAILVRTDESGL